MKKEILYEFAYSNIQNKIIHISEVEKKLNGERCDCICPICGSPMIAKIGEIRRRHFAHKLNIKDCTPEYANETALHKIAKEIIKKYNFINLPELYLNGKDDPGCNKEDENQLKKFKCFDKYEFSYTTVRCEEKEDDFIPDLILENAKKKLYVEIAVTHKVDYCKYEKIKKRGISCIEINIENYCKNGEFKLDKFEKDLIYFTGLKKWIYCADEDKYLRELKHRNEFLQNEYLKNNTKAKMEFSKGTGLKGINPERKGIIFCSSLEEIKNNISGKQQVCDAKGNRFLQCKICGKIDNADEFYNYGGDGYGINQGECTSCQRKRRQKNQNNVES